MMGQTYPIKFVEQVDDDDAHGCLKGDSEIWVKEDRDDWESIIFHELIHACLKKTGYSYVFKDEEQEEQLVRAMDNLFDAVQLDPTAFKLR